MHEDWILGKAFQELLRAVRHALEEAHVMTALITREHKVRSTQTLENFLKSFQRKAAGLRFPELLAAVNELLDPKLDFSNFAPVVADSEKLSGALRWHRKSFETRGAPFFILNVPRVKLFYMRGQDEIELAIGERVDAGDGRPEVEILMRFEVRRRSISVGERLKVSLAEFNEIAFACDFLGQQLASRLPKPKLDISEV